MKIIAKGERNTFLVEMSKSEVGQCKGLSVVDRRFSKPNIGDEFSLNDAYKFLKIIAGENNFEDLVRQARTLLNMTEYFKGLVESQLDKETKEELKYQSAQYRC